MAFSGGNLLKNLLKKEISWGKLFPGNVEWSSRKFWKMMSADVKASVKQWEIKELVAAFYRSFKEVSLKL